MGNLPPCIVITQGGPHKSTSGHVYKCLKRLGQVPRSFLPPGTLFSFSSKSNFSLKVSNQMALSASNRPHVIGTCFTSCRAVENNNPAWTNYLLPHICDSTSSLENFRDIVSFTLLWSLSSR